MLLRSLSIATCVLMLTACASSPQQSAPPVLPASLRQPCQPLTMPADGTGAAVLRTLVEWAQQYRECADRHRAAVAAVGGQ